MKYLKDVFNLLLLKDNTYRKIGNDKFALKKFVYAFYISMLATLGIIISMVMLGATIYLSEKMPFLLVLFLGLIFPFIIGSIILVIEYISTLIPFIIGLLFQPKIKRFNDFFKVLYYTVPLMLPFVFFFNRVIGTLYSIWYFFMLYKTYVNIMKLGDIKSVWAVILNVIVYIAFLFVFAFVFLLVFKDNPEIMAIFARY